MSIADKLLTVANNTRSVAEKLNAAKATASGNPVVLRNTIEGEPIEIKLSSKNLFDISLVPNTGGITNNQDGTLTTDGGTILHQISSKTLQKLCPELRVGDVATLTANSPADAPQYIYLTTVKQVWMFGRSLTITQEMLDSHIYLYNSKLEDGTYAATTISNIQIELGTVATEYTPYTTDFTDMEVVATGKNLIEYPYQNSNLELNGLVFTDNGDGTITVNGTATAATNFNIATTHGDYLWAGIVPQLEYTASLGFTGTYSGSISLVVNYYTQGSSSYSGWLSTPMGGLRTKQAPIDIGGTRSYIHFTAGAVADNLTLKPQLEYGANATEYEPYKEPQTAVADADAAAHGISSYGPTTTLHSANGAAVINAKYFPESAADTLSKYRAIKQEMQKLSDSIKEE